MGQGVLGLGGSEWSGIRDSETRERLGWRGGAGEAELEAGGHGAAGLGELGLWGTWKIQISGEAE